MYLQGFSHTAVHAFLSHKNLDGTPLSPRGPKTLLYLKSQCHYNMKGVRFGLGGPILRIVWGPGAQDNNFLAETLYLHINLGTKWMALWRWHFQMHFCKISFLLQFIEFYSQGLALNRWPCIMMYRSLGLDELTHWPLGNLSAILKMEFSILFHWPISLDFMITMP